MSIDLHSNAISGSTFERIINETRTVIVFNEYSTHYLMIAKQEDGASSGGRIGSINGNGNRRYITIRAILEHPHFLRVAAVISANMDLRKPALLFLTLRNYGPATVIALVDVFRDSMPRKYYLLIKKIGFTFVFLCVFRIPDIITNQTSEETSRLYGK